MSDLTDTQFEIFEKIEVALEAAPNGLTPSTAARKAHTDYATARIVLAYMLDHRYIHTAGNGAWTRYYAGRATS